jgi:hypothetical protein
MMVAAERWNQIRVAGFGAICGGAYTGISAAVAEKVPVAELAGIVLGGAMGGAVIFGIFAAARNWVVSRN